MKKYFILIAAILLTAPLVQASQTYRIYSISDTKIFTPDAKEDVDSNGPEAFVNTQRVPSQSPNPFVKDWSSGDEAEFKVNFGQHEFQGDPKGYEAFDENYSPSKWLGSATVSQDIVTPDNLATVMYDKSYTSGKYYYEVQLLTKGDGVGHAHALGLIDETNSNVRTQAITLAYLGTYKNYTYIYRKNYGDYDGASEVNQWSDYNVLAGDWVQVWIDYDNDRFYIKKLGTSKSNHIGVIEP